MSPMHEGEAVLVEGVSKSYGSAQALSDISLRIARGEVLGLLGPNGAGKSTLISIVAGLLAPDDGAVQICGHDVRSDGLAASRLVGLAAQDLGLYLQLPVAANLRFFCEVAGVKRAELKSRIGEVASLLDLERILGRRPYELSGGEKRRVHTAIAMLGRPAVLLLDEPTAGVDMHTRQRILDVVKALAMEGTAVCYTTHYLHEAEEVADSATILAEGGVIASGSIDDLIAREGDAVLELRFEGEVPRELEEMGALGDDGSVIHLPAPNIGATISRALGAVDHRQVRSIEIVRPSLENVYLNATGRRIEADMADEVGR
jgi:ABC-2 type transport system ATP-binding protein